MSQLRSVVRSGVLAVLAAACGGGGDGTTAPTASVASVTLNQSAATLTPQQTVTLVATTKDASGTTLPRGVIWGFEREHDRDGRRQWSSNRRRPGQCHHHGDK
jgi:hypothetical protein